MRAAAARRHASARAKSSTRWSLTGGEVGCTRKTSFLRTGSRTLTATSPSGNRSMLHAPNCTPNSDAIEAANAGLAVPAKIVNPFLTLAFDVSPNPLVERVESDSLLFATLTANRLPLGFGAALSRPFFLEQLRELDPRLIFRLENLRENLCASILLEDQLSLSRSSRGFGGVPGNQDCGF